MPAYENKDVKLRELLQIDAFRPDYTAMYEMFAAHAATANAMRDRSIQEATLLSGGADISRLEQFWYGKYPERDHLDQEIMRLSQQEAKAATQKN